VEVRKIKIKRILFTGGFGNHWTKKVKYRPLFFDEFVFCLSNQQLFWTVKYTKRRCQWSQTANRKFLVDYRLKHYVACTKLLSVFISRSQAKLRFVSVFLNRHPVRHFNPQVHMSQVRSSRHTELCVKYSLI